MNVGVPKEARDLDGRVGLGPNSVAEVVERGHAVYVQTGAGLGAGFTDQDYVQKGATIAYTTEEVYKRSKLICKVNTPSLEEIDEMVPEQIICTFAHLAAASTKRFQKLVDKNITVVAYEMLGDASGNRPILRSFSEIAGRLVPQVAASLLESPNGWGLLLAGIPGIPPAEVSIIGAGTVGLNAARCFAGMGAQVTVLDQSDRLSELDRLFDAPSRMRMMFAYPNKIAKAVSFSNVLVGAVLKPGERTPPVVTEQMVASMRPGSVIIDVSIDQGGCIETSRPTTLRDPTFVKHGVVHYCVPNFTALVARTASRALSNVLRPFVVLLASKPRGLIDDPILSSAVVLYHGQVVNPKLAMAQNAELVKLEEVA